ncbi:hypothetical protein A3SI_19770 [Nitritalea halalkaliphila LW7]|uniref:HNH endonuclease n=1 Tax=Nitritalea halalkaliphila LW7 TaxID=1189621 RepID=I5BS75_9BACT|nr:hypothetical protein [Nitritalea halalkaliphila]EIM72427.1 hypothetical protein A3SI_19770 [Nitritalea halalkaliphila LW7]
MTVFVDQEAAERRYREQLLDPRWKRLRQQILHRDGCQCRVCGSAEALQVHHRQYHVFRYSGDWKAPWQYPARLLVTLCARCHAAGHAEYRVPIKQL